MPASQIRRAIALAIFLASVALGSPSALAQWTAGSGFDSGSSAWQTATPANSSHSSGTAVGCSSSTTGCGGNQGALFSIPIVRTTSGAPDPSGIITNIIWISTGADTGAKLLRLWDKKPTNTTCKDNVAFDESIVDDEHLIAQVSFTPAAPAVTTGDNNTYYFSQQSGTLTIDYRNQDVPTTNIVYGCVVTGATDTGDDGAAVYLTLSGPRN